MLKKLLHNWKIKLASLALATLVWVVVMSYADPLESQEFNYIPITIVNDSVISEAGKSYQLDSRVYASVRVSASHSVMNSVRSTDFTAKADLSRLFDMTGMVPIELSCSNHSLNEAQYTLLTPSIQLTLEDILTKTIPLQVRSEGNLGDDASLGALSVRPSAVTIQAPESVVEKISRATVTVSCNGQTESFSESVPIRFFSESGSDITSTILSARDTTLSLQNATVQVEVLRLRTLPVVVTVTGSNAVAAGYRYTGMEQSVKTVTVSGYDSHVAQLSELEIPGELTSVEGLSASVTKEFRLSNYLPSGVTLADGEPETVTVTLTVEPLVVSSYDLSGRVELRGKQSGYEYEMTEGTSLTVSIRALEEDFPGFDTDMLHVSADVSRLTAGEYDIPHELSCDSSLYEIMNRPVLHLTVREVTEAPTESTTEEVSSAEETEATRSETTEEAKS